MYLGWPEHEAAYTHQRQFMLGSQLLVAPVGSPGDPATKEVWFPPGRWTDIFTRARYRGPGVRRLSVPLDRMPVFARSGAVVPLQDYRQKDTTPPGRLVIEGWPGRRGAFTLYEDAGDGLGFRRGQRAKTRFSQRRKRRRTVVRIGRAKGAYPGRPRRRRYELRLIGSGKPVRVTLRGRRIRRVAAGSARGWWYDAAERTVVIRTGRLRTKRVARFVVRR
jgi:hypothetical protein